MLLASGVEGSYLLRPSSKTPNQYALSIRAKDAVRHFEVHWNGASYSYGAAKFSSFDEFAAHFENQPVITGSSGVSVTLTTPFPAHMDDPSFYDTLKSVEESGRHSSSHPTDTLRLSSSSKEGYLTKIGSIRKSWKKRWCVVCFDTFKYFKSHGNAAKPLRVIDLHECSQCCEDDSTNKLFCFRLVVPWRTFYFSASSEGEMRDWIELINWKVGQNDLMK